ncbi:MAG: right-handed parallel beta-helix repeat-containing protein [Nannocystis sp.]|nr:parallel beta-helix domain-containing protein [Nannocystis sp.]MBA3547813.1 right-handed parallel beta-helix repeat-containing protein [Nannocystis sp.]
MKRSSALFVGSLVVLGLSASCTSNGAGDDASGTTEASGTTAGSEPTEGAPVLPEGCNALVEPGADAYAEVLGALMDANPGETVCMSAGTFNFVDELSISGNGVTLRGAARDTTILDFGGQTVGGNGVKITGDDVTITALTVKDTPGDGIRGDEVKNIVYDDVAVIWTEEASTNNGAYGFYPVGCDGVTIRNSLVVGARDAGIYVGQSTNVLVEDSEAYGNVAGVEFENTTDATVRRTHAHDNTAGILIFNLPGLPVKDGKRTLAYDNIIENNNVPNFGEAGTVVAKVPPGIGFMVLAADNNEIRNNQIRGNVSTGVVIVHYSSELFESFDDAAFNIYAEGNYVHDNTFTGNGAAPADLILGVTAGKKPGVDMLLDGCIDPDLANADGALSNCFPNNGAATFLNFDLCQANNGMTEDLETVNCMQPPLEGQT